LNENNGNINEINHELNEKENYEGKDKIINNILIEDNNKSDNNIQKEKEINYRKNKNYKEYSINELKQRKKNIEILFKDLCKNIIGNKELFDLDINAINSKEILKNKDSHNLIQILLMDEESSKKFQSFINYQKLNEFINSNDKRKDYLLEKYHHYYRIFLSILYNAYNFLL
jgi:hypothetical protein